MLIFWHSIQLDPWWSPLKGGSLPSITCRRLHSKRRKNGFSRTIMQSGIKLLLANLWSAAHLVVGVSPTTSQILHHTPKSSSPARLHSRPTLNRRICRRFVLIQRPNHPWCFAGKETGIVSWMERCWNGHWKLVQELGFFRSDKSTVNSLGAYQTEKPPWFKYHGVQGDRFLRSQVRALGLFHTRGQVEVGKN